MIVMIEPSNLLYANWLNRGHRVLMDFIHDSSLGSTMPEHNIRFPHSSLVALAAAYILLPTAVTDAQLCVAPNDRSDVRLINREATKAITKGALIISLSMQIGNPPHPKIGLVIGILGGLVSLCAGILVVFGFFQWSEEFQKRVLRLQERNLGQVLEKYGLDTDRTNEVKKLVDGNVKTLEFHTEYGTLITERREKGYSVTLSREEKIIGSAMLDRGTDIGQSWTDEAKGLVTPEWAALVDLYTSQKP